MITAILNCLPGALLFGLAYWIGFERGRNIEMDAQIKRIESLLERIGGGQ